MKRSYCNKNNDFNNFEYDIDDDEVSDELEGENTQNQINESTSKDNLFRKEYYW